MPQIVEKIGCKTKPNGVEWGEGGGLWTDVMSIMRGGVCGDVDHMSLILIEASIRQQNRVHCVHTAGIVVSRWEQLRREVCGLSERCCGVFCFFASCWYPRKTGLSWTGR